MKWSTWWITISRPISYQPIALPLSYRWLWSSWLGTIQRPGPYKEPALPLSYRRIRKWCASVVSIHSPIKRRGLQSRCKSRLLYRRMKISQLTYFWLSFERLGDWPTTRVALRPKLFIRYVSLRRDWELLLLNLLSSQPFSGSKPYIHGRSQVSFALGWLFWCSAAVVLAAADRCWTIII